MSIGRVGMLKSKNSQPFVPELLGRREIGLPPAEVKTNELIGKHVREGGSHLYMYYVIIVTTGQYKTVRVLYPVHNA